jgi:hypothetical protein
MFAELTAIAIIGYLLYFLFVKGAIWPILMAIFATYGGRLLILHVFPSSSKTVMTFMTHNVSYAAFIAAFVCLLGMGYLAKE